MRASEFTIEDKVAEGGADTSWTHDGDTVTLQDILELTKEIEQIDLSIDDKLKSKLLHWNGNPEEIKRINQVTVSPQFPILLMVDERGEIEWILDGNHRLHKAIHSGAETIPAKLIKPSNLNDKAKRVFGIKEQRIDEVPLPPDWDEEVYKGTGTFKDRIQYAMQRAERIGQGSSRVAFIIEYEGRPTVLKIAKNRKGLAQNNMESEILDDWYVRSLNIAIPIIDYDKENPEPLWIHTEFAEKANEKKLCDIMKCPGMDLNNIENRVGGLHNLSFLATAITGKDARLGLPRDMLAKFKSAGISDEDLDTFSEYADKVAVLLASYNLASSDLRSASNWGIYKGDPVIIDLGLTETVWDDLYAKK